MAVRVLILVLSLAVVTCSQYGLSCMQREIVQRKMMECFAGLDDGSVDTLKFGDGNSASMVGVLSERTCSKESSIINGMDCFYNFYGSCLNMRPLFPSKQNIRRAISEACDNIKNLENPCAKIIAENMAKCLMQKTQKRQLDILSKKTKYVSAEDEVCRVYKEELKCLSNTDPRCPLATRDAFYRVMNDLVPFRCKQPNLMAILKDNSLKRLEDGPR